MKEKMVQLLMCPGQNEGSAVCAECPYKGTEDCFSKLKVEVLNALHQGLVVNKPFNLEVRVSEVLREIGVPANIKGYAYLREAIMLVVNDATVINYITSKLYPQVAKKFNSTGSRTERAIRHAIEVAFDRCDLDVLHKWFGNTTASHRGKPTNSEFIAMVADTIRLEVYQHG